MKRQMCYRKLLKIMILFFRYQETDVLPDIVKNHDIVFSDIKRQMCYQTLLKIMILFFRYEETDVLPDIVKNPDIVFQISRDRCITRHC